MKEQIEHIPVPIDREEWGTLPRETPIYCTTLGQERRFWFWEDMTPDLIQAIDRDTGMKTAIGKAHNWTRRIEWNQPAPLVSFEGEAQGGNETEPKTVYVDSWGKGCWDDWDDWYYWDYLDEDEDYWM